jgi:septal ring factor EnvC (AmiA/AmiB activator)
MVDASFSRQRQLEDGAAGIRQRWIFAVALGVILIGLGYVLLQRGLAGNSAAVVPSATAAAAIAAREQVSNELLETTKGLQAIQQQAVDQLQVVQDQLVAQKAETKKLSEQIAAVTEKLDALQQSVADIPAPSAHVPTPAAAGKSR